MSDWREVGKVVGLQVQTRPMKQTMPDGMRVYKPQDSLISVEILYVTTEGALALDAEGNEILDAHNARHPETHNQGSNALSVGFTGHYEAMQSHFGEHLTTGIAGENIIVAFSEKVTDTMIGTEFGIRGADGTITIINDVYAMPPCEPFTRFCLQDNAPEAPAMKAGLQYLNYGTRGFVGVPANSETRLITLGDVMVICPSSDV